ncbi:DNA mismatch repair protein HSM3 [Candida albicans L26]|uniref:DNA mismatch repair protein HSM3 n=3 Tax=Candida albicans TaxID=5476 RepID=HSM3_CANAL|nr:Hsm3p [Candida albicans SC5314]Q59PP0.1 RecName: Full=DNA mismatch repair protein HSM3 [Candida albicans SC5314]EEQ47118.1 conserved hypothetical protein [Candida albicans WO-1]KGQ83665.1 DNA mismatch repair protein HSM3 [Candida albicans P37005]KGQ84856.1 DNA mismatch repair protein HSM3 [Candida albicans GC75]KGR04665.1 DNA mismatch repair protein HSM3 [Candida albicans P78048]KGR08395.1 DNA mismatch repair protein HSM3 [Candida albicans P37037]KGT64855.1 DNA mismatch repair protein HSM|eukprot:XP_711671.1 Hsm3p [Candida albicans SC5314]
MLDELSYKVLTNLETSYERKQPLGSKLIDRYTLTIDQSTVAQQSYFEQIIPAINRILMNSEAHVIDPDNVLIRLLPEILSHLSFEQILMYYPNDFILHFLFEEKLENVSVICLEVILLNLQEPETLQFLRDNNVISRLLREVYFKKTPISVLNKIERLITVLNGIEEINLLESCLPILKKIRDQGNTVLLSRYLDLVNLLLRYLPEFSPHLYSFTKQEFLKYQDDPLFLILLIQFYVKLVRLKAPVDLSLPLSDILSLYDKFDLLVKNEVVELVAQLSFTQSYTDILFKSQIFKTHNLLEVFEKTENSDIRLLSKANPQVIYELNNSIYPDVLAHLNLFTNNLYFPILLNFMSSTTIFYQLKLHLNNEKLSQLPMDKLFKLLLEMSTHNHSKEHLFNNLPTIMSTNLLETEDLRNNELWNLKLEILQNLLNDDSVPGFEFWHQELTRNYELMTFGRVFRNAAPRVDIIDETA